MANKEGDNSLSSEEVSPREMQFLASLFQPVRRNGELMKRVRGYPGKYPKKAAYYVPASRTE